MQGVSREWEKEKQGLTEMILNTYLLLNFYLDLIPIVWIKG